MHILVCLCCRYCAYL